MKGRGEGKSERKINKKTNGGEKAKGKHSAGCCRA
jgi:hypothetical protein